MYKLIAIDIDGTLLKTDKTLSPSTIKAIKEATQKGVKVILATGRPIQGVEKYAKELNINSEEDYGIACSGAFVQCLGTKKVLFESTLSYDDLQFLYNMAQELKITLNILLQKEDLILTPTLNLTTQLEAMLSNLNMKIIDFNALNKDIVINRAVYINENASFTEHLRNLIKRNNYSLTLPKVSSGNDELVLDKDNLPEKLFNRFTVLRPSYNTLEILSKGVSKGTGVNLIAERLGIKQEEIICIGDSGNDIAMIEYAGLGVAMGNASPHVKEMADFITLSNEEDGVAHVINKFILKES
jgi:Cof subfamily protein (haloacid dehalogenase superfamily)